MSDTKILSNPAPSRDLRPSWMRNECKLSPRELDALAAHINSLCLPASAKKKKITKKRKSKAPAFDWLDIGKEISMQMLSEKYGLERIESSADGGV